MRSVRLLVLALIVFLPWMRVLPALAQEASPVTQTWADPELDLAAMALTPEQMAALGLPGYGRFFNGFYFPESNLIDGVSSFYGQPLEETQAAIEPMGISRGFGIGMGLPSTPGDHESPATRGVYMNVIQYTNPSAANAYLDFITESAADPDVQFTAEPAPFALGDGAVIITYASPDAESGETYYEHDLVFRTGDLYVDTGLWARLPTEEATPVATPVAADGSHTSPAGTVEDLEALGRQALANIDAVRGHGSPNLPALLLRLGDDPLEATDDYTEGYRLLNGEAPPYYGDRDDDFIADPAIYTDATAAYELEEKFQRGELQAPGDFYLVTRLFAFPDEAAATAFMASRPDVLATGGMAKTSDAAPASTETLLPGEVSDLGDESLAFSFVRAFTDNTQYVGHEIFVRVGDHVAAMALEGPPDAPLQVVADIAAAQAACLEAGSCPAALPVPEAILAASMATGEDVSGAGTPAASTPSASSSPALATPGAAASAAGDAAALHLLWQSGGGPGAELYAAGSVVIAPDGNIWIFDGGGGRFQIFSPDGDYIESWDGTGGGGDAFDFEGENDSFDGDVAFDAAGHIYVVEAGARRVQVFDADRSLLTTWGSFGAEDGQFVYPMGLALDSSGNVYISDTERDDVQVFAPDGAFLRHFGSHGSDVGQLSEARYLTIDRDDTIWVADSGNNRVVAFAPDGTEIMAWGAPNQFQRPTDVTVDAEGNLYVADLDHGQVQVLDGNGAVLAIWEVGQTPAGRLNLPFSVALDGNGALYVSGVGLDHNSESSLQKFQAPPLP